MLQPTSTVLHCCFTITAAATYRLTGRHFQGRPNPPPPPAWPSATATAGGALTGKYLEGRCPPGSRFALFGARYARFNSPRVAAAVADYCTLAARVGLTPSQLAYAFCRYDGEVQVYWHAVHEYRSTSVLLWQCTTLCSVMKDHPHDVKRHTLLIHSSCSASATTCT